MNKCLKHFLFFVLAIILYYIISYIFISVILPLLGIYNMFIYTLLLIIGIILTFIILKVILNTLKNQKIVVSNREYKIVSILYLSSILFLLLGRANINLPYSELYHLNPLEIINHNTSNINILILLFNIIIFVPASFVLNINFKKFLIFVFSLEFLQFIFKIGLFNVSDILLYIMGFLIGEYIFKLLKKRKNKVEENEDEYIESGYENDLEELILDNQIKSIFINGKFGEGKTTLLNHVLKSERLIKNKKLELKIYGEYVEENYIDFLYEILKEDQRCLEKFFNLLNDIVYVIIPSIFLLISILINKILIEDLPFFNDQSEIFLGNLIIVVLVISGIKYLEEKLKKPNISKVEFIKKKIKKYDYIIMDDLDRLYINTKEIVKMIHFLYENINNNKKIIMLGYKENFKEKDSDILEKYYEKSFDIFTEVIVDKKIKEIKYILNKNWNSNIGYNNDLYYIEGMWLQLTPRKLIKIIKHINKDKYLEGLKSLNRNDFLFILTLYIENRVPMSMFYETINEMISNKGNFNNGNEIKEMNKKLLDKEELNLNLKEKKYLLDAYDEYYDNNSSELNRFFYRPTEYKMNSYYKDLLSEEEIIDNYTELIRSGGLTEYYYNTYLRATSQKEALSKLLDICEGDEILNGLYTYLVRDYFYDGSEYIKDYPNEAFKSIVYNTNGYVDTNIYKKLKDRYLETYDKLNIRNKLELLEREVFQEGEKYFTNKILPKDKEEIINKMIEIKRPYNYLGIFGEDTKYAKTTQIKSFLDIYLDCMKESKEKYSINGKTLQKRSDENDEQLKNYNKFKDFVGNKYGIDVSEYYFTLDD